MWPINTNIYLVLVFESGVSWGSSWGPLQGSFFTRPPDVCCARELSVLCWVGGKPIAQAVSVSAGGGRDDCWELPGAYYHTPRLSFTYCLHQSGSVSSSAGASSLTVCVYDNFTWGCVSTWRFPRPSGAASLSAGRCRKLHALTSNNDHIDFLSSFPLCFKQIC